MSDLQVILSLAALVTAVGTAVYTVQKVLKNFKANTDEFKAEILQEAKQDQALIKTQLEGKINSLQSQLNNLKENVEKDLEHIKDTYNGEIRNLGEKIEGLREELRNQHGNLVQLLTKLIDNRD